MLDITSEKLRNGILERRTGSGCFPIDARKLSNALVKQGFTQENAPDRPNVALFCRTARDIYEHLSNAPTDARKNIANAPTDASAKAAFKKAVDEADLLSKCITPKPLRQKLTAGGCTETQPDKALAMAEVLVRGPSHERLNYRPDPEELCNMLESVLIEGTVDDTVSRDASTDELDDIESLAQRASEIVDTINSRVRKDVERHARPSASAIPDEFTHQPEIGAKRDVVSRARTIDDVLSAGKELLSVVTAELDTYQRAERDRETARANSDRALEASIRNKDDEETVAAWLARCAARRKFTADYAEATGSATDAAAAREIGGRIQLYAKVAAVAERIQCMLDDLEGTLVKRSGKAVLDEADLINQRSEERDIAARHNIEESFAQAERALVDAVERVGGLRCDSLEASETGEELRQRFSDDDERAATRAELTARVETMRSCLERLAGGESHPGVPSLKKV